MVLATRLHVSFSTDASFSLCHLSVRLSSWRAPPDWRLQCIGNDRATLSCPCCARFDHGPGWRELSAVSLEAALARSWRPGGLQSAATRTLRRERRCRGGVASSATLALSSVRRT